jgi:hypothetical protein
MGPSDNRRQSFGGGGFLRKGSDVSGARRDAMLDELHPGGVIGKFGERSRVINTQLRGKEWGIFRPGAKGNQRTGIADDRVLDTIRNVAEKLIGEHKRQSPIATFREDICEAVGDKVLKFVGIEGEVGSEMAARLSAARATAVVMSAPSRCAGASPSLPLERLRISTLPLFMMSAMLRVLRSCPRMWRIVGMERNAPTLFCMGAIASFRKASV